MLTTKTTLQKLLPILLSIQKHGALGLAITTFIGVWFLVGDIIENAGYGSYYAATVVCFLAAYVAVRFIDGGLPAMTTYSIFELLNGKMELSRWKAALPVFMLLGLLLIRISVSTGITFASTKITAVLTDVEVDRDPLTKQTQAVESKRNTVLESATQKRDKALAAAAAKAEKYEATQKAMIQSEYRNTIGTGGFATLYSNKEPWFMQSTEVAHVRYRAKAKKAEEKRKRELDALDQTVRKMTNQANADANKRYDADMAVAKTLGSSKALALMEKDLGAKEEKADILNDFKSTFIYFLDFIFFFMFIGGSVSIAYYMKDVYDNSKQVLDLYPEEQGAWAVMASATVAIEQTVIALLGGIVSYFQLSAAKALKSVAIRASEATTAATGAKQEWSKANTSKPVKEQRRDHGVIEERKYTPPAQPYPTSGRQSSPFSQRPPTERETDDKDTETDGGTVAPETPQHRNTSEPQHRNSDRNTETVLTATPKQLPQLPEKQERNTATPDPATPAKRESAVTLEVGEMRKQIEGIKGSIRSYRSREKGYRAEGKLQEADAQLKTIERLNNEVQAIEALLNK